MSAACVENPMFDLASIEKITALWVVVASSHQTRRSSDALPLLRPINVPTPLARRSHSRRHEASVLPTCLSRRHHDRMTRVHSESTQSKRAVRGRMVRHWAGRVPRPALCCRGRLHRCVFKLDRHVTRPHRCGVGPGHLRGGHTCAGLNVGVRPVYSWG